MTHAIDPVTSSPPEHKQQLNTAGNLHSRSTEYFVPTSNVEYRSWVKIAIAVTSIITILYLASIALWAANSYVDLSYLLVPCKIVFSLITAPLILLLLIGGIASIGACYAAKKGIEV